MRLLPLLALIVGLGLQFQGTVARAAEPADDIYVRIFKDLQEADRLAQGGEADSVRPRYQAVLGRLEALQQSHADWHPEVVAFRIRYVKEKLGALAPSATAAPQTASSVNLAPDGTVDLLARRVRELESEKTLLEARLREALAPRPMPDLDPRREELESKLLSQQKELDQLRSRVVVSVTNQALPAPLPGAAPAGYQAALEGARQEAMEAQARIQAILLDNQRLEARLRELEADRRSRPPVPDSTGPQEARASAAPPAPADNEVRPPSTGPARSPTPEGQGPTPHFRGGGFSPLHLTGGPLALARRVESLLESNRVLEASVDLEALARAAPGHAVVDYLAGRLEFEQGRFEAALPRLVSAAEKQPGVLPVQLYLGRALMARGLPDAAELVWRRALEVEPGYSPAHYELAVLYMMREPPETPLARWHYRQATSGGPGPPGTNRIPSSLTDNPAKP